MAGKPAVPGAFHCLLPVSGIVILAFMKMNLISQLLMLVFLVALATVAGAEVEKIATPNQKGLGFVWWPKLPAIDGWKQDNEASWHFGTNALAPVGATFSNAETVMYAKALFKSRIPDAKTLVEFIARDKADILKQSPNTMVDPAANLTTADRRSAITVEYLPKGAGNWERVAYLEEGEFYLVFTISSRTQNGFEANMAAFERLISQYREKPVAVPPK